MSTETSTLVTTVKSSGELAASSATAHSKALVEAKYIMALQRPRNILSVRDKILEACARPGFAGSAWYSKPVGGGKVRGPSIRFAETAIQCMTNITVMPSIVYEDREKLVLDVQVIDLESNTSYGDQATLSKTVERKDKKGREVVGERINTSSEKVYIVLATEDEMANKTNSAKSKIIRNSGLRLIPQDIIEEAEWAVRDTLEKGGDDPAKEKKRMADAFSFIGIKPAELEKYLGHSVDSISPAELSDLREVYATLKDGEAKWSDYVEKGERKNNVAPARATPLDPFKPEQPTAAVEAEVVPEPQAPEPPADDPMDDAALVDFMGMIQDCDNAEALTKLVQHANAQLEGKKLEIAKQAIAQRAKDLKVKWNKATGGFTA